LKIQPWPRLAATDPKRANEEAERAGRDQRSVGNGIFALHFLSPLWTNSAGAFLARVGDGCAPPQQPGINPHMEIWKT
jgi:hypothetical protein